MKLLNNKIHKWSRIVHKDLSFFFAGMLIIYAVSGLVMNHRSKINPYYDTSLSYSTVDNSASFAKDVVTVDAIKSLLTLYDEQDHYTHYYYPQPTELKIFLKGGSSLSLDVLTGQATYEKVTKRVLIGSMAKLHYNPQSWWTYFSDAFAVGLLVIVITGFTMLRGKQLLNLRSLSEIIVGILIPLLFLWFFS